MPPSRAHDLFMAIHSRNPREAPGSEESTARAFGLCRGVRRGALVLDVGCGPGAQTLQLAEWFEGRVVGVDLHRPYLQNLAVAASRRKLRARITPILADMNRLGFESEVFDLVWSEGAIYNMGFRAGLEAWREVLAPAGHIAVSEATWLTPHPPAPARAFWDAAYPAMQSVDDNLAVLRKADFSPLGHFTLPATCWLDYYGHLEARIAVLDRDLRGDPEWEAVVAAEEREIDLYRRLGDSYGYVFYVARKTP